MGSATVVLALVSALVWSGCLAEGAPSEHLRDDAAAESSLEGDAQAPRDSATWEVVIQGAGFREGSITIQVGDTVEWTNRDLGPHTVTADGGAFDSGPLVAAPFVDTFSYTFDAVGQYAYHCKVHGAMEATITVVPALQEAP